MTFRIATLRWDYSGGAYYQPSRWGFPLPWIADPASSSSWTQEVYVLALCVDLVVYAVPVAIVARILARRLGSGLLTFTKLVGVLLAGASALQLTAMLVFEGLRAYPPSVKGAIVTVSVYFGCWQ